MRILVFGGTGLIGKALLSHAGNQKHELFVVTRKYPLPETQNHVSYVSYERTGIEDLFSGQYAIINLAGAGIGDRLWTRKRKDLLLQSRLAVTTLIADMVNSADTKPEFILQASAVGFYGNRGEESLDEKSPKGRGFLPEVTAQWEDALKLARPELTRQIFIRTGLVLSNNGGLLSRLILPYKLFSGGHFGTGRQWMPWIHEEDEVNAILFLIENNEARGVFNLASPNPERMKEFCKLLGKSINRPSWLHIPAFLIRVIPGGFGEELLLTSQHVSPSNLLSLGYAFHYPTLDLAFHHIFRNE